MSRGRPQRVHRLPQRLDWKLVPAPLDLSLSSLTEKSPLPAIIVTPPQPSCPTDFAIAFLAPPPSPTLRERLQSLPSPTELVSKLPTVPVAFDRSLSTRSAWRRWSDAGARARTPLLLALLLFVLVAHLTTHGLAAAARRPYMSFAPPILEPAHVLGHGALASSNSSGGEMIAQEHVGGWWEMWFSFPTEDDSKRAFVIES